MIESTSGRHAPYPRVDAVTRPPAVTRRQVLEVIRTHLGARGFDPELLVEDASFVRDLDLDSLTLQTLAQDLEDEFGLRIGPGDAARMQTVGQAVDFVVASREKVAW